jgi:hypothetical protein
VPALTDRVLYAPQPGTAFVDQCKSALISGLLGNVVFPAAAVKLARVVIENADIKDLPLAPYELIPAPAAGIQLQPIYVVLAGQFGNGQRSGAYGAIDAGAYCFLSWGALPASGQVINIGLELPVTQFLTSDNYDAALVFPPNVLASLAGITAGVGLNGAVGSIVDGSALSLTVINGAGVSFNGGHVDNRMLAFVVYAELDLVSA